MGDMNTSSRRRLAPIRQAGLTLYRAPQRTHRVGYIDWFATDSSLLDRVNLDVEAPIADTSDILLEMEDGSPLCEVYFVNSRYLIDITQQIQGENAQFALADAASPTLVRDTADASALYVLMPMRV